MIIVPDGLAGLVDPEEERLLRVCGRVLRLAVAAHSGEDAGGRRQLPDEEHHERLDDGKMSGHAKRRRLNEDGLGERAVRRLRNKDALPGQRLHSNQGLNVQLVSYVCGSRSVIFQKFRSGLP